MKGALNSPSPGVGGGGCDPLPPSGAGGNQPEPAPAPSAPSISPAHQEIYGEWAQAGWTLTVAQNPETDQALVINFGNGAGTTVYVPEGSGNASVAVSNLYHFSAGVCRGVSDGVEWTVTAAIAAVENTVDGILVSPSGGGVQRRCISVNLGARWS